jgi:predicted phage gp36 major capsid-like protein
LTYVIIDRMASMTLTYVPSIPGAGGRPSGQAGFFGWRRVGATVTNADAFRVVRL